MNIQMQPVSSSNIKAIGYDPSTLRLRVEFLNGSTYIYSGVPEAVWSDFSSAASVGSYFAKNIKGKYTGERE